MARLLTEPMLARFRTWLGARALLAEYHHSGSFQCATGSHTICIHADPCSYAENGVRNRSGHAQMHESVCIQVSQIHVYLVASASTGLVVVGLSRIARAEFRARSQSARDEQPPTA